MKLWFYHHLLAFNVALWTTSGSPWGTPGDPKDQGLAPCEADQMCRSNRLRFRGRPGDDSSVWTGCQRVPHWWKNPMAPMIWRTQLGGFISVYLIFWHTHTKGSQHPSLGPPPEDRWHQSRQWRWRWCWRPCHHPGNYNFLAIRNAPFVQKRVPIGHQGLTRLLCL